MTRRRHPHGRAMGLNLPAIAVSALVLALGSAASIAGAAEKQMFQSSDLPPGLPFSAAVRAGDMIYVSGAIGHIRGEPRLVPGGIASKTRQALTCIRETRERAGRARRGGGQLRVLRGDIDDFAAMNDVYRTFFPEAPPARSTVAVAALALGARSEIECIALTGD